jgi:hypothetical protein
MDHRYYSPNDGRSEKTSKEIISAGVIYHAQVNTAFNPGLITDPKSALKDEIVEEYIIEPRPYNQSGYVTN